MRNETLAHQGHPTGYVLSSCLRRDRNEQGSHEQEKVVILGEAMLSQGIEGNVEHDVTTLLNLYP
jgi:hypothetical protein